jgi:hypothetical protein
MRGLRIFIRQIVVTSGSFGGQKCSKHARVIKFTSTYIFS